MGRQIQIAQSLRDMHNAQGCTAQIAVGAEFILHGERITAIGSFYITQNMHTGIQYTLLRLFFAQRCHLFFVFPCPFAMNTQKQLIPHNIVYDAEDRLLLMIISKRDCEIPMLAYKICRSVNRIHNKCKSFFDRYVHVIFFPDKHCLRKYFKQLFPKGFLYLFVIDCHIAPMGITAPCLYQLIPFCDGMQVIHLLLSM